MLKIYEFNDMTKCIAELNKAFKVKTEREINGAYTLSFQHPAEGKSEYIKNNRLVDCEGQFFRIIKVGKADDIGSTLNVYCEHIYNADAIKIHIQNVPDFIGASPYAVIEYAFANTAFTLISDEEIEALGLKRVDHDGFLIDFFSVDKTSSYEVMNTVIENCGKGEIYIDNYNIALVERIGKDTNVELRTSRNLQNVSIERDITDMVTRLYPYGYEDLHIGTVNNDVQYIDSPNIEIYGVKEGYKDYSDYKTPGDVLNRALWEFAAENEERIDVPAINISGTVIDVAKMTENEKFFALDIGDRVIVNDEEVKISERINKISKYPYEPLMGDVSIGRVKKDLFFYLNQMGRFSKNYKKASTNSGKVSAKAISGVVSADGVNVSNSSGSVTILTDMISMSDSFGTRFVCGVSGGVFSFAVYDANGRSLYLSEDKMKIRGDVLADTLSINGIAMTVDSSNNLYFNGKKIQTE